MINPPKMKLQNTRGFGDGMVLDGDRDGRYVMFRVVFYRRPFSIHLITTWEAGPEWRWPTKKGWYMGYKGAMQTRQVRWGMGDAVYG